MNPQIKRAAVLLGGNRQLGAVLGIASPAYVSQVINGVRPFRSEWAPLVEQATNGAVTCEQLVPDVAWHVLRGSAGAPLHIDGELT